MYELIGQLLAAIYGLIVGNNKLGTKYKYWISFLTGILVFVIALIASYFEDKPSDRNAFISSFIFGFIMSVITLLLISFSEFFNKKVRKNK